MGVRRHGEPEPPLADEAAKLVGDALTSGLASLVESLGESRAGPSVAGPPASDSPASVAPTGPRRRPPGSPRMTNH